MSSSGFVASMSGLNFGASRFSARSLGLEERTDDFLHDLLKFTATSNWLYKFNVSHQEAVNVCTENVVSEKSVEMLADVTRTGVMRTDVTRTG